jgi:hypothetical protein
VLAFKCSLLKVGVKIMLRPTVSLQACLGVSHSSKDHDRNFNCCQGVESLLMWYAFSNEWTGLEFRLTVGPNESGQSRVRVPQDSWSYWTVSDLTPPPTIPGYGGEGVLVLWNRPSATLAPTTDISAVYLVPCLFSNNYSIFESIFVAAVTC